MNLSTTSAYNTVFEKNTSNRVVVSSNDMQPMAAVEVVFEEVAKPANNEILYTSSDGNIIEPKGVDAFWTLLPACRGRDDAHWERFAGVRDAETTSDYAVLLACEVLKRRVIIPFCWRARCWGNTYWRGCFTEVRRAEIMRSGMSYRDAQS